MAEPARILAVITPEQPWGVDIESPIEHVAQSVANAIEDLHVAIWTAKTKPELVLLRTLAESLITRLEKLSCTALTLDEHFDDMRRP